MSDNAPVAEPQVSGSRLRRPLMLGGILIAAAVCLWFYLSGGRYVETDNAQLQAGKVMIAANVSGKVVAVEVKENQFVHAGDVLFRIDPSDFQAGVASAEAQLSGAIAEVGATRADYLQAQSEVSRMQAQLAFARSQAARQQSLLKEGISSQSQVDQAVLAVRTASDGIAAAQAHAAAIAAKMPAGSPATQPASRRAAAMVQTARIALENTVVRAAQDGIVTKVNQVQVGSYVTAGKPLFVMTGTRYWVEANFKENQLRYMRLGQPVTIHIDAFPDEELTGRIASFSPGTGNSFSVLPAENATGNWVKVTQRLPVEIAVDRLPKDLPLHAGLSVKVTVDTGHQRRLLGKDTPPNAPLAAKSGK
ncbi:HlyD family secretion protein [Novosphingobium aquae]|uniref:HlyD family secretion protein n=1 Tax=Novosphingobium aquae TaxID=3133435 RepID=A0ABU8S4P5_9SPHN